MKTTVTFYAPAAIHSGKRILVKHCLSERSEPGPGVPDVTYESYQTYLETRPLDIVANILPCIIHQTNYLLDQQLRRPPESPP